MRGIRSGKSILLDSFRFGQDLQARPGASASVWARDGRGKKILSILSRKATMKKGLRPALIARNAVNSVS